MGRFHFNTTHVQYVNVDAYKIICYKYLTLGSAFAVASLALQVARHQRDPTSPKSTINY